MNVEGNKNTAVAAMPYTKTHRNQIDPMIVVEIPISLRDPMTK